MDMIRIDEAIARAKMNGKKVLKKDIAARIWPNSLPAAQQVNMTNLCSGKSASLHPEWLNIICEMCDCSADFLIGRTNE